MASKKQTGEAGKTAPPAGKKKFTLADAHGHGISAVSSFDLTDHVFDPDANEGKLGSQGSPQPSGGATGMRGQLGSFEAGQSDAGGGGRGDDMEQGEHPFIGVNPEVPKFIDRMKKKKPAPDKKGLQLADAHGHGILAESTHDLSGHVFDPGTNEGKLGSQGEPQPSGGATGMRAQLGSFEAGQSDTGGGAPGEDVEQGERPFIGVRPPPKKEPKKK